MPASIPPRPALLLLAPQRTLTPRGARPTPAALSDQIAPANQNSAQQC